MRKQLLAPLLLSVLVAAGWAFSRVPVRVLEFANTDTGAVRRLLLSADGAFFVTYQNSIFGQPVTEEFALAPDDAIVLTGVQSESGAVLEYLGFQDGATYHALERRLGRIVFRIAAGEPQRLLLGTRELSFLEFGHHGDRLALGVARVPLGRALFGGT